VGSLFSTAPSDAIHQAIRNDQVSKVRELILKNPKLVNAKDRNNNTPLHFAAQTGNMEIVRLLLSKGAEVNERNNEGITPLHLAVQKCNQEACRSLIGKGADLEAKDKENRTPTDWAIAFNHRDLAEYLKRRQKEAAPAEQQRLPEGDE
jgi:ankyrin repeat protein